MINVTHCARSPFLPLSLTLCSVLSEHWLSLLRSRSLTLRSAAALVLPASPSLPARIPQERRRRSFLYLETQFGSVICIWNAAAERRSTETVIGIIIFGKILRKHSHTQIRTPKTNNEKKNKSTIEKQVSNYIVNKS